MLISLPNEFLLSNYVNEQKLINEQLLEQLDKRDFHTFTKEIFNKFNFLFLKSLNILKKFSLKELYENSSFIFSGIFYSHEIILLSLKPGKFNKDSINLCKILLQHLESKENYSNKKYNYKNIPKSSKSKKKKNHIKNSISNLNEDLRKSIEQIKFEYRSLLVEILDKSKILDTRELDNFYNKFIEEVLIPDVKYLCDFMKFEANTFEEKIRTFMK
ncbi:hypothetical protein [Clostridium tarantellae]|uniref:Uncharacterized protein n=1 Tax=Clostridium tarantellae TaxID=39493 RepID=A0A6I1MPT8_9CLOT|nr:hypothetical protein [Clostridium tarantellae]MPQ45074.1 hypothetical protein [Clostridium tarantellae]